MTSYRFVQQTFDEEIVGERFSSCADDDAALAFARVLLAAHPVIEVWRGQRFVGRVAQPLTRA
jgi:phosphopantothenate synthetase